MQLDQNFIDESINIRSYIKRYLSNWQWFLISVLILLAGAWLLSQKSTTTFIAKASILIRQQESANIENFLYNKSSQANLYNEAGILKSLDVHKRAVKKMAPKLSRYRIESFRIKELYDAVSFKVKIDTSHIQNVNTMIYVEWTVDSLIHVFTESNFVCPGYPGKPVELSPVQYQTDTIIKPGDWLINGHFAFKIELSDKVDRDIQYAFIVNSLERQISFYNNLTINIQKESSILEIQVGSPHRQKSIDLTNALVYAYLNREVRKTQKEQQQTIEFIDVLIDEVADTLAKFENDLTNFQVQNLTLGIDAKANSLYSKYNNAQDKLTQLSFQLKYYEYIYDLLGQDKVIKDLISPATLGIREPIINDLVRQLLDLYSQKSEASFNSRKDNPVVDVINEKIDHLKESLFVNTKNNIAAIKISIQEHEKRVAELEGNLQQLPITNKKLQNFERKFKIIDGLYTFLLKKRSESRIVKASIHPVNEVIEYASPLNIEQQRTGAMKLYILALMLGVIVPVIIIEGKRYIINKVEDEDDLRRLTDLPVVASIFHSNAPKTNINEYPKTDVAETFRTLRTNLRFFINNKPNYSILITSAQKNEGKSFIARNLALTFSKNNKKTVLLNFDLRKPDIERASKGLSTYLCGESRLENIIDVRNEFLHHIPAGPMPPEPGEIINNQSLPILFKKLKESYEVVIIDCPPIGPISDAAELSRYSDMQLFIVRLNVTSRDMLKQVFNKQAFRFLSNTKLVVNDVRKKNSYYYGYYYYDKHKS